MPLAVTLRACTSVGQSETFVILMKEMKKYKQKLRDVWLQMPEFRPWLRRDPDDSYRAHCRLCKCCVNTKICDLRAHALTKKHMKWSNTKTNTNPVATSKGNDVMTEVEYLEDALSSSFIAELKPKVRDEPKPKTKPKAKARILNKSPPLKREKPNAGDVIDYEEIIENIALYEPEEAMYSNSYIKSDIQEEEHDQIEANMVEVEVMNETNTEPKARSNQDEEMMTNAVAIAMKSQRDSAQIFGDFVADRLRSLTNETSEFAKDKIMQIILDAAALDRSANGN